MIRQTGGFALGATSTRSSSCSRAMCQRLGQRPHPELLAVCGDQQHLAGPDAVVDPGFVVRLMWHHLSRSAPACTARRTAVTSDAKHRRGPGKVRQRGRPGLGGSRLGCGPGRTWYATRPGGATERGHRFARASESHFPTGLSCEDTRVSSLWTPYGEDRSRPPAPDRRPGRRAGAARRPAAVRAMTQASRARRGDRSGADARAGWPAPVGRLDRQPRGRAPGARGAAPRRPARAAASPLARPALAIDAMAALVDAVGDRLGPNAEPLRQARRRSCGSAFVQVSRTGRPRATPPGER